MRRMRMQCLGQRTLLLVLTALAALVVGLMPRPAAAAEAGPLRTAPRAYATADEAPRVIVRYKALGPLMRAATGSRGGPQHASTLALRLGLGLSDGRVIDRQMQVLVGQRGQSAEALAARLATDEDVEFAEPDRRRYALAVPNDPLYAASSAISPAAGQWYLRAPDSTLLSAINAAGAWDLSTGSSSIVVAVLDTGVLSTHPDLSGKLVAGYDFVSDTTVAGDGDGRDADPTDPGDWTTASSACDAASSSWHGTQTSSLIGAHTDNGIGMASVGYNVRVQPVRVLGKCGGYDSDIVAAMLWAGGVSSVPYANPTPARVINLSLSASGSCTSAYTNAIAQLNAAGVVVVAAAGNEGLDIGTPANCSGAIAVTGLRHTGTKVGYSNLGPKATIGAPAGNCVNTSGCLYPIITATNSGTTTAGTHTYSDGASNYAVGTSFAAPLVAGTVSLMLSVNPALTASQVTSLLKSSARAFPTSSSTATQTCSAPSSTAQDSECICTTSTCGAGMLDARAAVQAAAALSAPTAVITASASTVTAGSTVTLSAAGSTVPSGRTISSYLWAITSGAARASFSGATDAASATLATLATAATGSVVVQLTITDSTGTSASTTVTITVNEAAAPAVSLLASATTVSAGSSVSFDGSDSRAASGLSIVSYQWSLTSGSAMASFSSGTTASTATVQTNGAGSGTFTVQLTVTDSAGRSSSTSQAVTVTALAPTASISTSATSVGVGTAVTLSAAGSSAPTGRTITSYQWSLASGSDLALFSGSTTGASAELATRGTGTVTVQLVVTDSAGATDTRTTSIEITSVVTSSSTSTGSGGSGGGAFSFGWLALLALAAALLTAPAHLQPRRKPRG